MILVDTSVWVDHFRKGDDALVLCLGRGDVLGHDFVIGELALGLLRDRARTLRDLQTLPAAVMATSQEVLALIDGHGLAGIGIGYVDAHLLAAAKLSVAKLWTRDRRLADTAARMGVAHAA